MADRASRKQKQRLKRERKRRALRKAQGASPAKLFRGGDAGAELVASYMNDDWRERGQAVAFVLRRARDGRLGMASFMVDLWCAGLKDAWGRVGISRDKFEDMVDGMSARLDDSMADVPLDEIAGVVAGAIRFARQNGFRLPPHYQRWTALIGELHPEMADLSDFGVAGGTRLRWVGPMHDLRARLIGSTVEEFLARPDVEAITDMDGVDFFYRNEDEHPDLDDIDRDADQDDNEFAPDESLRMEEDFEATAEVLDEIVEPAATSLRRWCFANGKVPEEKIDDALPLVIARGLASITAEHNAADPAVQAAAAAIRAQEEQFLDALPPAERGRLTAAILQVEQFLQSADTPKQALEVFGLSARDQRS